MTGKSLTPVIQEDKSIRDAALFGIHGGPGAYSFADCLMMKIPTESFIQSSTYGHLLYDVHKDQEQLHPMNNEDVELVMAKKMITLMEESEAPTEQFKRLGYQKKDRFNRKDLHKVIKAKMTTCDNPYWA